MGGGKSQTSTQSVSIPPEVLARYNSVNAQAQTAAANPFQPYTGEFVAPVNAQQQAGISATNTAASQAQPYYGAATQQLGQAQGQGQGYLGAATGAAFAGAMPVNPSGLDVNAYMNPYTQNVVGATQAALNQQFGQQNAAQQAQAIKAGAFGGERAGLQNAQLQGQQALTESQAIAPLYQANYNQALAAAQQQQGVGLSAAQANRTALQGLGSQLAGLGQQGFTQGATTAQQLAGLGTGAQTAALQGAQAQTAAGTLQQQTQQAGDTAQYQQYLQQQGYPFQVAQFLAGIAEGTGALSGSTTTTTQPAGFFSDERLKTDVKEIGKTNDGQKIYSYKYKGDDRTQIGLMAQDVEKSHPDAVGLMGGYKTVDYKKATEDAERPARATGGLIPAEFDASSMGGAVTSDMAGEEYARGGYALGGDPSNPYGAAGYVPSAPQSAPHQLMIAPGLRAPPQTGMSSAMQTGKDIQGLYNFGKSGLMGTAATKDSPASAGLIGGQGSMSGKNVFSDLKDWMSTPSAAATGGLIVPGRYAAGGDVDPYDLTSDPLKETINEQKANQLSLPKMGGTPGSPQSGASQISAGLGLANAGMNFAENVPEFLAMFAANGGAVPRQAHADGGLIPRGHFEKGGDADLPISQDVVEAAPGLVPADGTIDQPTGIPADAKGLVVDQKPAAPSLESDSTMGLIAKHEKFKPTPYWDVNHLRAGFGSDTVTLPDGTVKPVDENTRVTVEDAERDLARRKMESQGQIRTAVGDDAWNKLDPGAQDALTSTTYNYGRFPRKVAQAVQGGNKSDIAAAVNNLGYDNGGVNAGRRAQEASMIDPDGKYAPVTGKAKTSMGAAASQMAGPGAPSSTSSDGSGLIDKATSSSFLVPALGFLGSMLASQRPTLGGALGEGLLGGTGAYMAQQKLPVELAYKQAETNRIAQETTLNFADRLAQFNVARAARNQPPITSMDEFKRKLENGSLIEATGEDKSQPQFKPTVQTDTSGTQLSGDAANQGVASPVGQQAMNQVDWSKVAPSHNIPQKQKEIEVSQRIAASSIKPEEIQKAQERQGLLQEQIQKIMDGDLVDIYGNKFTPPAWQQLRNQRDAQKAKATQDAEFFAKTEEGLRNQDAQNPAAVQGLNNLADIMTKFQSDPTANFKTYIPAIAESVGLNVNPDSIQNRAQFEQFIKQSRDQLFQRLGGVAGSRILQSEVQRMGEAVVDPQIQPAANRSIVGAGLGGQAYNKQFYTDYRAWKKANPYATADDYGDWQLAWQNDPKNSFDKYIENARANTPVKGDLPSPENRKDGWLYMDNTPAGKKIYPKGTIFRWDAQRGKAVVVGPVQ